MSTILRKLLWPLLVIKMMVRRNTYMHTTGWMESMRRGYPCRANGEAIPWMNFPIIDFLEERLNQEIILFEYGSGFSTSFYAKRVRHVSSVEYDQAWFEQVSSTTPDNVSLLYRKQDVDGSYCRTIKESGKRYDVVIVDGRDRVNCVKQSIHALSESGVIILDDSERPRYADAFAYAREHGFRILEFEGLKPTKLKPAKSSIFYREKNCLGI